MSFNQSGTFVYSPDISVVISTENGIIDVSADVMNFTVDREMNAVSSFNCTLNNPGRQYNYGMPKQISTMDRITVFLKRTQWVQVFTGYITYAPIETLVPTPIQITANCTLRILQVTYWDDTLIQYQSLLLNFMDNAAESTQQTLGDGGVATAVVNMLNGVAGWDKSKIHIQGIPYKFIEYAAQAYTNLIVGNNLSQNAVQELSLRLSINGLSSTHSTTDLFSTTNNYAPDGGVGVGFTASQARAFITSPIAGGKANSPGKNTLNPVNIDQINEDIYYCSAPWGYLNYQINSSLSAKQQIEYKKIQDNSKTWLASNQGSGSNDGRLLLVYNLDKNRIVALRATSIPQKKDQSSKGYAAYDSSVDYLQIHPGVAAYLNGDVDDPTKWNASNDPGPVSIQTNWANTSKVQKAGPIKQQSNSDAASTLGVGDTTSSDGLIFQQAVDKLIYVLIGQLGDRYSEGTSGPEYRMTPATTYGAGNGFFDCSGLAYWAYQQIGITLQGSNTTSECGPTDGSHPELYGAWSDNTMQPQPGDLIFWEEGGSSKDAPQHVSIMVGAFGQQAPPGIGFDNAQIDPDIGYIIESSHSNNGPTGNSEYALDSAQYLNRSGPYGNRGPNAQQISWQAMSNGKNYYGGKYMGARSPLTLHPSWTGAQLNNLMIPNTSQDNITAPGTSTGTNASTSNNKPTTTDPNSAEQRAIFNLAGAYNNLFGMPQYDLRASAMLGTPRAFLLDNPVMQDLTQIMNAGLRSYMSAPNGDFVAWFPDYYGIYGTDPVLDISPVEIIDFQIYHDDNQLATHVGVVGDTNGIGQQVSNVDYITTNGIVSIQDATTMQMLFGKTDLTTKATTQNIKNSMDFLNKYGMRPYVNEQNMIHSVSMEYFYALYQFMQQWTNQYVSNVTFTFMPELYPGMRVSMNVTDETNKSHNYMFYVTSVIHTGDRSGGFTTQATLTAPMKNGHPMSYGLNLV